MSRSNHDWPTCTQPCDNTDWKSVAKSSHKALTMCMRHLKAPVGSSGVIGEIQKDGTFKIRHWREIVADALEKFPGCKVDREACHALDLSKKNKDKFFSDRNKNAAAQKGDQNEHPRRRHPL